MRIQSQCPIRALRTCVLVDRCGLAANEQSPPCERLQNKPPGGSLSPSKRLWRELLFDLIHQGIRKPGLPQLSEIFKDNGIPRLVSLDVLLSAILQIERPR